MTDGADRRPGGVRDDDGDAVTGGLAPGIDGFGVDVHGGVDTDADGLPDTLLDGDGADLLVLTDLDGDALADRVLRIGADGAVDAVYPSADVRPASAAPGEPADALDGALCRLRTWWDGLFADLYGPDR